MGKNLKKVEIQPEIITEKNRSKKVVNNEFGEILNSNLEERDKPRKAELDYENGELTYENYEDLDKFIEEDLIPKYIKKNRKKTGKNIKNYTYLSVTLSSIIKLRLSELETKHVIEYLSKKGIKVTGVSQNYTELTDYNYIRNYSSYLNKYIDTLYPEKLTKKELQKKFIKFYRTKDKDLREELILRNYKLVPFTVWKYISKRNIDYEDAKEYGYIGLIYAVDHFNPFYNNGYSFTNYAIKCIKGIIKRKTRENQSNTFKVPINMYEHFNNAKQIVEKKWDDELKNNPEMIDDIIDTMISKYRYPSKYKELYKSAFLDILSFEEVDMNSPFFAEEIDYDEKILYEELKEQIKEILQTLSPNARKVIKFRFGLDGEERKTLKEIAKILNISSERVRQIEKAAIKKIKHSQISNQKLHPYLEKNHKKI